MQYTDFVLEVRKYQLVRNNESAVNIVRLRLSQLETKTRLNLSICMNVERDEKPRWIENSSSQRCQFRIEREECSVPHVLSQADAL
jgi:hypothetical protein